MAKQTAGRNILGEFAPQFAALNDDVLFGEVWSREAELPAKMRSIVTISALVGKGIVDTSLQDHLAAARETVLLGKKWWKSSPNWRFMPVGPMHGLLSAWPRTCTLMTVGLPPTLTLIWSLGIA